MPKKLRVGDWVEVRSKEEILQTLDCDGRLDGMPFIPEMLAFCGRRCQVYKVAHKTCDYSVYPFRVRRLARTVHLETRCDGKAHGGCQAGCLLYWKEEWLKPLSGDSEKRGGNRADAQPKDAPGVSRRGVCTEDTIWTNVQQAQSDTEAPTYICQMTQIPHATTPLAWWDVRQYWWDYRSGNVAPRRLLTGFMYWAYYSLSQAGIGVGRPMRWFYDKICFFWTDSLFPRRLGSIPEGQPTPSVTLNLEAGELVRVKSHREILKTVDGSNKNRGMYWDAELVPYCGGTYGVFGRVERIISERTGKMVHMQNPCIVLDSVVCQARYSSCRLFCPKGMYPYWREIWLERVETPGDRSASKES